MAKKKTTETPAENVAPAEYQHEGLRSIYLELENFKNIDKKIVQLGGKSMIFMGKNEAGKSTLIQAMLASMNSKLIPSEPIKKGEDRAMIRHIIGGKVDGADRTYITDIYFTAKDKKGRLVVTNEKGETLPSPAGIMKSIIGHVSFDPLQWLNDTKAKKIEMLKSLTGKGKEIDLINMEIKKLKDSRKMKGDRADELEGALNNHGMKREEIDLYSTPIPVEPIQAELNQIGEVQKTWDGVKQKHDEFKFNIENITKSNGKAVDEILRLQGLIEEQKLIVSNNDIEIIKNQNNLTTAINWLNITVRPDITEVNQKLSAANLHNQQNLRIGQLGLQQQEMIRLKQEAEGTKSEIEAQEGKRNDIIANSQLPIPNFTFSDEEMFLDGLPLEEGQQNTATLIDVSIDIAIALNPGLKIIFIHEGNLLDKNHLKAVVKKIEEKGYMAIVELVSEDNEVECAFTEDYLK